MHIAIIGASADRAKYGNKAVRAYAAHGDMVYPINPRETEIEGLRAYKNVLDVPESIDAASLYVPASVGMTVVAQLAKRQVPLVYINPGAESDELVDALKRAGIAARLTCSIRAIGKDPADYP